MCYCIAVMKKPCATASLSCRNHVLLHRCHGEAKCYCITVTYKLCATVSLSHRNHVLLHHSHIVTVTSKPCATASLSHTNHVLLHHCHIQTMCYCVTVTQKSRANCITITEKPCATVSLSCTLCMLETTSPLTVTSCDSCLRQKHSFHAHQRVLSCQ